MKSMTGYGYEEYRDDALSLSAELKGYNNRFLDIFINLPPFLSALEGKIREQVSTRCQRGKVEVSVRIKELATELQVSSNTAAAKAYYTNLKKLSDELGLTEKPSLSHLLNLDGVLVIDKVRDLDKYWSILEGVLQSAMLGFENERIREGTHTEKDILGHITVIEEALKLVNAQAPAIETTIRENLQTRFKELLGDRIEEDRILSETAVLLMKYSISEEIARLHAHLKEFRLETQRNPSPGKKLDFLCQEINREINTIGSKSPVMDISRAVVDMKDALEKVREQLRNVE